MTPNLHFAVRPFLMADKIIGSQNHLTDLTVKACFVPILKEKRDINAKWENENVHFKNNWIQLLLLKPVFLTS